MFVRRLAIVAGSAAAMVAVSAGSAFAHHCYFTSGNPNANANRAQTPAFASLHDLAAAEFGLCEAGIEVLVDELGVPSDTVMHMRATMAGGSGGNKAIGHLDFEDVLAALPGAFAACGTEMPPMQ
jgi:hypothetical protein